MRFEKMDFAQKMKTLRLFHKRINRDFFNGSLKDLSVDIENTNKGIYPDNWAIFTPCASRVDTKTMEPYFIEKISFAHEFESFLAEQKTQKEQVYIIASVMLHEMIHQYCYENGLDDENHGGEWENVAGQHGLISIYKDGVLLEENASPVTAWVFSQYSL